MGVTEIGDITMGQQLGIISESVLKCCYVHLSLFLFSSLLSQTAQKVLKNAKVACSRLGQYRMPFAWAARYEGFFTFQD